MGTSRLEQHPILGIEPRDDVPFTWDGEPCIAKAGEVISSAVIAHGEQVFGHHPKDGSPQGLYCANGQCAQCLVLADGRPAKACMTPVTPGMVVAPLDGLPTMPADGRVPEMRDAERREVPVMIIGGGPAGLSAATELGRHGIPVLLVDDKDRLGGKLVLQTHRFFGSINAVHAGTRGTDIGRRLEGEARAFDTTEVWTSSTVLAVFSDGWVGVWRGGARYALVKPSVLLVAAGSRERALPFRGNTLPGVLGAGAFQTLLNRDLVKAAQRLFVVGGGNVGLITAYHALQAGVEVVGLVEAAPECGGYRVHRDKLARLGVPIMTGHTIVAAWGPRPVDGESRSDSQSPPRSGVHGATIARVDARFRPIAGTERHFACDTVLVAVGLDPVDEFTAQARAAGMTVFAAGDCDEIAEASAAIFAGKIRGLEIARELGADVGEVPSDWIRTAELLRSKPGPVVAELGSSRSELPGTPRSGVHPVFHCTQEIPCNPCTSVCPQGLIHIDPDDIRHVPEYLGEVLGDACIGCERCVRICPGLAITLVDHRDDPEHPVVTIPFEFDADALHIGDVVTVLDTAGEVLGNVEVVQVRGVPRKVAEGGPSGGRDGTLLVKVRAPGDIAPRIAGLRLPRSWHGDGWAPDPTELPDDEIVCRCERVTAGELRELIRAGHRDVNELKTIVRAGMGACGAKTCAPLIERLFRDEGVPLAEVTPSVRRPLFVEVPLGVFAGVEEST
jgi:NADPH-dependent 2,4-dienoyl-CoA reductase/sulfur reductase-like enzyme/Fe-S-cluster-containing hydrogenase component 2/bacterioferritin-associated ferredoxin